MIVNYTLIFTTLVLFAGLAVDAGMLERSYLQLQGGAQAAVMASSIALQRGGSAATITAAGKAVASMNGFVDGSNGVTVTIENPPSSGSYSGNAKALRAIIKEAKSTSFLGILGMGQVNMQAQSVVLTPTQFSLSSAYNVYAIYTDGHSIPSNGGFDADGYAFSANALGAVRAWSFQYNYFSHARQLFANADAGVHRLRPDRQRSLCGDLHGWFHRNNNLHHVGLVSSEFLYRRDGRLRAGVSRR